MCPHHILFLLLSLICISHSSLFDIQINGSDDYEIYVNGDLWFESSDIEIHCDDTWYSTSDGSLEHLDTIISYGSNTYGVYQSYSDIWKTNSTINRTEFVTEVKLFDNFVIFSQFFPYGATGTTIKNTEKPITVFPTFAREKNETKLGYIHYNDDMGGWSYQTGKFPENYNGGIKGGPIAFFDRELKGVGIFSSISHFTTCIANLHDRLDKNNDKNILAAGLEGNLTSINQGFGYSTIFYVSGNGINEAFMEWGDLLLKSFNKERPRPDRNIILQYLGYSTTAYYFYNPITGDPNFGNYEETLKLVDLYSKKEHIPYQYFLLDSWWYGEKYYNNSIIQWTDNSTFLAQRFPSGGLEGLYHYLGNRPFFNHIGKWSSESPYVINPDYGFIVEENYSIPQNEQFWDFIFENATGWGLRVLKQDHMNEQILYMNATLEDNNVIRNWLISEGKSAQKYGIDIMYCMDFPNAFMLSLELNNVVISRASNDYVPDNSMYNWKIGVTSMVLWPLGLYGYKDSFYTSSDEIVIKPQAKFFNYTENHSLTHALASCLSAGPVGIGDGYKGANKTLINMLSASNGLLLKPDRPIVTIDNFYKSVFDFDSDFSKNNHSTHGQVWSTYTVYNELIQFHYVLGINLEREYTFEVDDLLVIHELENKTNLLDVYYAYKWDKHNPNIITIDSIQLFESPFHNIRLERGKSLDDINYYVIVSGLPYSGYGFLGELGKIVPISKQRFPQIISSGIGIEITINGAPFEQVDFAFVDPSLTYLRYFSCTLNSSGSSSFFFKDHDNSYCV
eukprot:TRINITY_DN3039_c0_g1_i1.p1 TRINITY_DN3039_c0_g1~~TRINITY_DN3039_c0_g1_i1.p1  ORF type:complete len:790 (+),score=190.98 TRINITY_DN3039_c0_g1_i1:60-2429(+)